MRKKILIFSILVVLIIISIAVLLIIKKEAILQNSNLIYSPLFLDSEKTLNERLSKNLSNTYNIELNISNEIIGERLSKIDPIILNPSLNKYNSNTKFVDAAAEILLKTDSNSPDHINLKFRKVDDNNYYLLQIFTRQPAETVLFRINKGKKEQLMRSYEPINKKPDTECRWIICFFDDCFFMTRNARLTAFLTGLPDKRSGSISYEAFGGTGAYLISIKHIQLDSVNLAAVKSDLMSNKIYPDSRNYSWNKYSPEHLLNVNRIKNEYLQRIEIGDETRPSILLPLGYKAVWKLRLGKNPRLKVSLALIDKFISDPERIRFVIEISSPGTSTRTENITIDRSIFLKNKWKDVDIDLNIFSNRETELSFKTDAVGKEMPYDANITTIWGNPELTSQKQPGEKNIILIVLDAVRPDHLGCYGYSRNTSPNIDALARNGTIFTDAVTAAPWTLPSHMAILTSFYPSECGYNTESMSRTVISETAFPKLKTELKSVAEYLAGAGYSTAAFTGGGMLKPEYNFDQGFGLFSHLNKDKSLVPQMLSLKKWIQSNKQNKFFALLHTYETHCPYSHDFFNSAKIDGPMSKAFDRYDSGILFADSQVGNIVSILKNEDIFDDTLIIIISDHGENFAPDQLNDNNGIICGSHGTTLYDSELKIPLIIGGGAFKTESHIVSEQVRTIDLLPTILDILCIPIDEPVRGRSIRPLLERQKMIEAFAYSEGIRAVKLDTENKYSVRTKKYKLIEDISNIKNGRKTIKYELYDLKADPNEIKNLKDTLPHIFRIYKDALDSIRKDLKKRKGDLNYGDLEDLKNLGYIDN